jgi:hypothetical protein
MSRNTTKYLTFPVLIKTVNVTKKDQGKAEERTDLRSLERHDN